MNSPYITVHSVAAMDARRFTIWIANIENTPEKLERARAMFDEKDWYFEFHDFKYDLSPVVK